MLSVDSSQTEDVGKEPSLDSLDLGFPDDDEEEHQSDALFRHFNEFIFNSKIFEILRNHRDCYTTVSHKMTYFALSNIFLQLAV